jgi:hypothetical protein
VSEPPDEDTEGINRAITRAIEHARAIHRAFGRPLVVWRDGRVQHLDPVTLEAVPPPADMAGNPEKP